MCSFSTYASDPHIFSRRTRPHAPQLQRVRSQRSHSDQENPSSSVVVVEAAVAVVEAVDAVVEGGDSVVDGTVVV